MVLSVQKRLGTEIGEAAEASTEDEPGVLGREIGLKQRKGCGGAGAELVWGAPGWESWSRGAATAVT